MYDINCDQLSYLVRVTRQSAVQQLRICFLPELLNLTEEPILPRLVQLMVPFLNILLSLESGPHYQSPKSHSAHA
jgi:hypothetical protein